MFELHTIRHDGYMIFNCHAIETNILNLLIPLNIQKYNFNTQICWKSYHFSMLLKVIITENV